MLIQAAIETFQVCSSAQTTLFYVVSHAHLAIYYKVGIPVLIHKSTLVVDGDNSVLQDTDMSHW